MNLTPYQLRILLDVYVGMPISVPRSADIYPETMGALAARGFIECDDIDPLGRPMRATAKLHALMEHIFSTPDPVMTWEVPTIKEAA